MEQEYCIALAEVNIILQQMQKENLGKIPKEFIQFVEENRDKNYVQNIKINLLEDVSNLRKETKIILGLIYRDFFKKKQVNAEIKNNVNDFTYEDVFKIDENAFDNFENLENLKKIEELEKLLALKNLKNKSEILDIENEKMYVKIFIKIKRYINIFISKLKR